MKIGVVKHLNARPLSYGIEKSGEHEIVYENPSFLKDELICGNLDAALISSVECLRNADTLSYSLSTGVCASTKVRSILYFENKFEPVSRSIPVDRGSRTSVALLQILIEKKYGFIPETIPTDPKLIQESINLGKGSHLLFGDNALVANYDPDRYRVIDLAEWWNQETGLGFCFAFWAFPKERPVSDDLFYISLEYGLKNLEEIIQMEKRFPRDMLETYLKQELHYIVNSKDKAGFRLFSEEVQRLGLGTYSFRAK
jgi:chorismate dehydratase